jgi:hypothetical protein
VLELESKALKFEGIKFEPALGEPPNKLCNSKPGLEVLFFRKIAQH